MADSLRRDHHYVAQMYLKQWTADCKQVWTYRTLVSHAKVPLWSKRSVRGVAYQAHLYTRVGAGGESDEVERWLDREFETPAQQALEKATSNERMTPEDWRRLVRFAVAQDVRTPARLIEGMQRWPDQIQRTLKETMEEVVRRLERRQRSNALEETRDPTGKDQIGFPVDISSEIEPGAEEGFLKAEVTIGRSLWLFHIKNLLSKTVAKVPASGWTILSPPKGLAWFTSDNPVVRLNYYEPGRYDFKGGWRNPGSEILFPLSSNHLLYNQIGKNRRPRGEVMPRSQAEEVRRIIAQHAYRMIFSMEPDDEITGLRPRVVDAQKLRMEREHWREWHSEQSQVERELIELRKKKR